MIGDILQPTHLLFVLVIALLVLGPKRLPEVGRSLGRGIRDFKTAISGDDEPDHQDSLESPAATQTPAATAPVETTATPTAPPEPAAVAAAPPAPEQAPPADHAG